MSNLSAIGECILVQKIEETTSSGLLFVTDKDAPTRGKVIDIGSAVDSKFNISIGDIIYFSKHATDTIDIDGEKMYIVKAFSILAKENNDEQS